MVRKYFRFRRLLLGLAFAAIAVPVTQAQAADSGFWTERPVPSQSSPHSDGFNWTDAGIGAAVTFGAAAVLLAAIAVGRRYRSRPDRAGLART